MKKPANVWEYKVGINMQLLPTFCVCEKVDLALCTAKVQHPKNHQTNLTFLRVQIISLAEKYCYPYLPNVCIFYTHNPVLGRFGISA